MVTENLYQNQEWLIIRKNSDKNEFLVKNPDGKLINMNGNTSVIILDKNKLYHNSYVGKFLKDVGNEEKIINVSTT